MFKNNWTADMKCTRCDYEVDATLLDGGAKEDAEQATIDCSNCDLTDGLVVIELFPLESSN